MANKNTPTRPKPAKNEYAELFAALPKMRAECANSEKNNPAISPSGDAYVHDKLSEVLRDTREPLANHGIAIFVRPRYIEAGHVMHATVTHESGVEWPFADWDIPKGFTASEVAALQTFTTRYTYHSVCGITGESLDDIDEKIQQLYEQHKGVMPGVGASNTKHIPAPKADTPIQPPLDGMGKKGTKKPKMTKGNQDNLGVWLKKCGFNTREAQDGACMTMMHKLLADLTDAEAVAFAKKLEETC